MSKKKKNYKPRKGFRLSKGEAQVVGETIESLQEKTPNAFIDAVADKSHPFHHKINWNDKSAAHERRLEQARYYMRGIEVEIEMASPVKAYHSIEYVQPDDRAYTPHNIVIEQVDSLEYLSGQFYDTICAECKKAEDLGMRDSDPAWRKIIKAVKNNPPGEL